VRRPTVEERGFQIVRKEMSCHPTLALNAEGKCDLEKRTAKIYADEGEFKREVIRELGKPGYARASFETKSQSILTNESGSVYKST
jgi:hypothetical protein